MRERRSFLSGLRRSLSGLFAIALLVLAPSVLVTFAGVDAASAVRPGSASLRTPDFDETLRWYQEKLGFRLISSQNYVPGRTAVLERNGFLLEITEVDHVLPQPQEPHATGTVQITRHPVVSLLVQDVDEEVERLQKLGVDILQVPEDDLGGSYRTAQIRDNGRHRIELREPLGSPGSFNPVGR